MNPIQRALEQAGFFDAAVLRHGFTDYMRDYELIVSGRDGPSRDDVYRYHFVGCVESRFVSRIPPEVFARSLPDEFVYSGPDYPDREEPNGFIWGVRYSGAFPGLSYICPSERAAFWSEQCGIEMHEVLLETEAYDLSLVFFGFRHEYLGSTGSLKLAKQFPIGRDTDGSA
jgi:hypothetical protein